MASALSLFAFPAALALLQMPFVPHIQILQQTILLKLKTHMQQRAIILLSSKAWHVQVRPTSLSAVHFCIQVLAAGQCFNRIVSGTSLDPLSRVTRATKCSFLISKHNSQLLEATRKTSARAMTSHKHSYHIYSWQSHLATVRANSIDNGKSKVTGLSRCSRLISSVRLQARGVPAWLLRQSRLGCALLLGPETQEMMCVSTSKHS